LILIVKEYIININSNRNNIVNNSNSIDSENNSIDINNVVNKSIGENRVNKCVNIYVMWYRLYNFLLGGNDAKTINLYYKKEWDILFNNQIISGDYSKTPFLVRSAALFAEIIPRASIRQGLSFRQCKCKLTKQCQH